MVLIVFTLHYHCHHPHYSSFSCSLPIPLSFILSPFSISLSPRHNTNPSVLHSTILWSQEENRRSQSHKKIEIQIPQKSTNRSIASSSPSSLSLLSLLYYIAVINVVLIVIAITITFISILTTSHFPAPYLSFCLSSFPPFPFLFLLVITPSFTHQDDGPKKKTTETAERIPWTTKATRSRPMEINRSIAWQRDFVYHEL